MPCKPVKGRVSWRTSTGGTVRANQLTFEYLTQGDGPLALCIHGFPDSPYSYSYSYRYLLPALAGAGYRAVAPFNRGFAPTELPDDRHHIRLPGGNALARNGAMTGEAKAPPDCRRIAGTPGNGRTMMRGVHPHD
jgi:pimeloyl-ACP methyl ester carboxylesterase